jgi:penicillin-binding protein 2
VSFDFSAEKRARVPGRLFMVFFMILLGRFFQLQVLSGSAYRVKSDRNSVRQIPVAASRGLIYDREGRILVENRPSYSLYLIPHEYQKDLLNGVVTASILKISQDEIEQRIMDTGGGPFTPVRLIRDMDFGLLSIIEENRFDMPGIFYQVESVRTYPSAAYLSHTIGYLGEINKSEISSLRAEGYQRGDIIGKSGIERRYDSILRGERGYRYVEVDVKGREVGNFEGARDLAPVPGKDLKLTLDLDLQVFVEKIWGSNRGAVIVLNPQNGEILAALSKPDFSLESFAKILSPETWEKIRNDPQKPLLDRTIQAQIPPGSTYKLVVTLAALSEHVIGLDDTVYCDGSYQLGNRVFHCWKSDGHGKVDLLSALKESCNVYYYQLGIRVGLDIWARFSRYLKFGEYTRIDLFGEARGLLPDRKYLDRKYGGKGWGKGMMMNLAVGQGDLLVTPIQMAQMVSAIAMNGVSYNPHIVHSVRDPYSENWIEKPLKFSALDGITQEAFYWIKEGMSRVVNEDGGTGRGAWMKDVEICGKTGTAQNPHGEDHAWFVGFAPRENPCVAIALFVENGGSGGVAAAPLVGQILKHYFHRESIS